MTNLAVPARESLPLDDCCGDPPHTGEEPVRCDHGEIRDDFNSRPGGE